jgi:hypothetical protein
MKCWDDKNGFKYEEKIGSTEKNLWIIHLVFFAKLKVVHFLQLKLNLQICAQVW